MSGMKVFCRIAWHSDQYWTGPVWIPDVSGMHDFYRAAPNLLLSISIFKPDCRYLLEMTVNTENLHKS